MRTHERHLPPGNTRPVLDNVDQRLAVAFSAWMIVGLFIDGWAHDNNRPESFFTPWHGILYSGFLASTAAAVWSMRRHQPSFRFDRSSLPVGHGLTLLSLGVFGIGGIGDLVWHETLGVEVGVEALLSPTHLLLLVGGLVLLTGPLRSAWRTDEPVQGVGSFLGPLLSLTFSMAVAGFFLIYVSPFVNRAASAGFTRSPGVAHDHPASDPAELLQLLGVASILLTTVVFVTGIQLLLRRWPAAPAGTFSVMLGLSVALLIALDEFRQPSFLLLGLLAGVVADVAVRRLPVWSIGSVAVAVLWTAYFALSAAFEGGVAWTAELWTGTTVLAALIALAMGLLASPPALDRQRPLAEKC
jgi:hypothetical protein